MPIRIKKHSAFRTQAYVISALFKREMITRFGKYKLGLMWLIIDPLASVIILGVILGPIMGRSSGDIPYPFFLLCGYMMLRALTGPLNMGVGAIAANQGLLVFRQVQPIDPFITRFIFELFNNTIAFIFFCVVAAWIGITISTEHLFTLFYCIILTWLTGCGLGLVIGVKSIKIKELEKVQQYVQRPLIFVSGVLYPTSVIPLEYQKYLFLNPIVHTVEITRHCLLPNYILPEGINLFYPMMFCIVCLAFGMMTYTNNRHTLTER